MQDLIERVARAGYAAMLETMKIDGHEAGVAVHDWDEQPEQLRRDWRTVARAMLAASQPTVTDVARAMLGPNQGGRS